MTVPTHSAAVAAGATTAVPVPGHVLAAALQYAAAWRGKTVVIKVGGSVLDGETGGQGSAAGRGGRAPAAGSENRPAAGPGRPPVKGEDLPAAGTADRRPATGTVASDLALLHRAGIRTVLVHGGGPEVTRTMERLGLEPRFVNGLRVTDAAAMEVAEMVLSGAVNKRLVSRLAAAGLPAVGLSGRDGGLLRVRPHPDARRLGFVGEPERVDTGPLRGLLEAGFVPVLSPIGLGEDGAPYNVNADAVAAAVAAALAAQKLILLTDVAGIFREAPEGRELCSELDPAAARRLADEGVISRGMVPKVEACLAAISGGVASAHIVAADAPHGLLLELFTEEGIGTMIRGGTVSFPRRGLAARAGG